MVGPLLLAMAAVLTCWTALAFLFVGLGLLVPVGWKGREWDADRVIASFWLGWLVAIAVLQAWTLAAPVAPWSLPFLAGLAALALWCRGAGLAGALVKGVRRRRWTAAAVALLAVWLSNRALGPPVGDSGLYHLGVIRWLASHPTVPGLANVVRQFGFHHPSLLWSAALEVGPLWGRSSHLAMGLLVAAVGARGVLGLARALRPGEARPVDLFAALLLPVVVGHAVTLHELRLSGPDPDTAAALTGLAAATALVAALTGPEDASAWPNRLTALLLATLASLLKLSLALFGAGLVLVAAWTGRRDSDPAARRRALAVWLGLALLLAMPWLARGVRLSGYPFYPSGLFPAAVDWRLPEPDRLRLLQDLVGSLPPVVDQLRSAGDSWVQPWLVWQATRIPELALLPAALTALGLALLRGAAPGPARRALWILAAGLPAVAIWVTSAPHPRLAYGVLWACAAAAITAAGSGDLAGTASRRRALLAALLLALPAFPALHRIAAWSWLGEPARAVEALLLGAGGDHGFHPTPRMEAGHCVTASGLSVGVPVGDDKIWDSPLPAATRCDPGLALRRQGDLGQGFRLVR
jgi:hypothetical protein